MRRAGHESSVIRNWDLEFSLRVSKSTFDLARFANEAVWRRVGHETSERKITVIRRRTLQVCILNDVTHLEILYQGFLGVRRRGHSSSSRHTSTRQ